MSDEDDNAQRRAKALVHRLTLTPDVLRSRDQAARAVSEHKEQLGARRKTLSNHLSLLARYADSHAASEDVSALLHKESAQVSHRSAHLKLIDLLDPFAMVLLRNQIVLALGERQILLDAAMALFLRERPTELPTLLQGDELRCWIELALRFTAVPLRIQCTRDLMLSAPLLTALPNTNTDVARLALLNRRLVRIVHADKVGKLGAAPPVTMPLDDTVSAYLFFYLRYCRPAHAPTRHAFTTARGAPWKHVSRDLKVYLRDTLRIPVDALDPSGHFIHASRAIGLACYGLRIGFDLEKMRRFAILMRHDLATMQRYYTTWSPWHQAQQAMREFLAATGTADAYTQVAHPSDDVWLAVLHKASRLVIVTMGEEMEALCSQRVCRTVFSVRDQGTQCGDPNENQQFVSSELHPQSAAPSCPGSCGGFLAMYGPCRVKRDKHFGQFFLACPARCNIESLWLPQGYVPSTTRTRPHKGNT